MDTRLITPSYTEPQLALSTAEHVIVSPGPTCNQAILVLLLISVEKICIHMYIDSQICTCVYRNSNIHIYTYVIIYQSCTACW